MESAQLGPVLLAADTLAVFGNEFDIGCRPSHQIHRHRLDLCHVVVLNGSRMTVIPFYCDATPSSSDNRTSIRKAVAPSNAVTNF
jgi:hypothetical protein